jgi:hypothetical protein
LALEESLKTEGAERSAKVISEAISAFDSQFNLTRQRVGQGFLEQKQFLDLCLKGTREFSEMKNLLSAYDKFHSPLQSQIDRIELQFNQVISQIGNKGKLPEWIEAVNKELRELKNPFSSYSIPKESHHGSPSDIGSFPPKMVVALYKQELLKIRDKYQQSRRLDQTLFPTDQYEVLQTRLEEAEDCLRHYAVRECRILMKEIKGNLQKLSLLKFVDLDQIIKECWQFNEHYAQLRQFAGPPVSEIEEIKPIIDGIEKQALHADAWKSNIRIYTVDAIDQMVRSADKKGSFRAEEDEAFLDGLETLFVRSSELKNQWICLSDDAARKFASKVAEHIKRDLFKPFFSASYRLKKITSVTDTLVSFWLKESAIVGKVVDIYERFNLPSAPPPYNGK